MKANHIIIGAGRSGTTTLNGYITQHPKINSSIIKEVHFFSINDLYRRGIDYLHSYFNSSTKKTIHFADTYAFTSLEAPLRLKKYNPEIKITIILREPISRAYSNYQYAINNGHQNQNISFLESRESNPLELDIVSQNNLCHFYGSLYHKHLSYWLNYFPKEQFFICTTNQLKETPQELLNNLFKFLNIETIQLKNIDINNPTKGIRFKLIQQFLLNRNHSIRNILRPILSNKVVRNTIIKSKLIDWLYQLNSTSSDLPTLSKKEILGCESFFKSDLEKLKSDFGIEF